MWRAAKAGDVVKMHDAVAKGADVDTIQKRRSALSVAAERGHYDAVHYLLNNNAQDIRTCKGDTALHVACRAARERVTELLVHRGANHWAVNNKGHTPYEVAMRKNHVLIVRLMETLTFPFLGWFEVRRGKFFRSWGRVWVGLLRPRPGDDPTVDRGVCQLLVFKSQSVARPSDSIDLREAVIRVVSGELPALEGVPAADGRPRRPASRGHAASPAGSAAGSAAAFNGLGAGAEEPPAPAAEAAAAAGADDGVVVFTVTRANGRAQTYRCPARVFRAFYAVVTGAFAKGAGAAFEVDDYGGRRHASREELESVARAAADRAGAASVVDPALAALPPAAGPVAPAGAVPVVPGVALPAGAGAGAAASPMDGWAHEWGAHGDAPPPPMLALPVAVPAAEAAAPLHVPAAAAGAQESKEGFDAAHSSAAAAAPPPPAGPAPLEPLSAHGVPAAALDAAPEHLLCPVTTELMLDPVCAADGHTYERAAITAWLATHATSPATGEALPGGDRSLRVNHSMRSQVVSWLDEQRAAAAVLAATAAMPAAPASPIAAAVAVAAPVQAAAEPVEAGAADVAPLAAHAPAEAEAEAVAVAGAHCAESDEEAEAAEALPARAAPPAARPAPSHAMAAAVVAPAASVGGTGAGGDAAAAADADLDEAWDDDLEELQRASLRAPWADALPRAPSGSVAAAVAAIETGAAGAADAAVGGEGAPSGPAAPPSVSYPSLSMASLPPLAGAGAAAVHPGAAHAGAAAGGRDEFADLLASLPAAPADEVVVHELAVPRLARSMETQWSARANAAVVV